MEKILIPGIAFASLLLVSFIVGFAIGYMHKHSQEDK